MATYKTILRNINLTSTYGTLLCNEDHVLTYEKILQSHMTT